jgi:hypothetical protein
MITGFRRRHADQSKHTERRLAPGTSAEDEDRRRAVSQYLHGLAAEHESRNAARQCEAMAIRSQPFAFAVSIIA